MNSGTTKNLRDVFFTSRDTGYVIGEDSTVLKTVNGGTSWTALPKPSLQAPGTLQAIWMWRNGTGFMTGDFINDFLRTGNSGNSWTSAPNPPGNPCYPDGYYFASPTEGYLYGRGCFGGGYIASYNGSGWSFGTQVYYGVTSSSGLIGLKGLAKDTVTGSMSAVGDYGIAFHSTNGFVTFDTVQWNDTVNFSAVDAAGNDTFYAVSSDTLSYIYESTDGGQTWHMDLTYLQTFFYPYFNDVDMHGTHFGVAAGGTWSGDGYISMRGNQGWLFYQDFPHIFYATYVVDSTLAFAVGDSGSIYRYGGPTGIEAHNTTASLNVYPSPVTAGGELQLDAYAGKEITIDVMDATGRVLLTKQEKRFGGRLPVATFTTIPGMYFLRIASGKETASAKIIVR